MRVLVNKELERIWKKEIVPSSGHYPGIYLQNLKKITKNLIIQNSLCSVRDSNLAPPENKFGTYTCVLEASFLHSMLSSVLVLKTLVIYSFVLSSK
jgi:hypothetical protein